MHAECNDIPAREFQMDQALKDCTADRISKTIGHQRAAMQFIIAALLQFKKRLSKGRINGPRKKSAQRNVLLNLAQRYRLAYLQDRDVNGIHAGACHHACDEFHGLLGPGRIHVIKKR